MLTIDNFILEHKRYIFALPLIIMVVLLAGFAAAGFSSRYLADDYCYDAEFISQGFWNGHVHSYMNDMTYSPNRYSLTFFSGVAWALGGIRIAPVLPMIVILIWVAGLYYFYSQAARTIKIKYHFWSAACFAVLIPFFTLLIAPNRYEIIYWRSGMLPYLAPIILNVWLAGRYFSYLQRPALSLVGGFELGLLSFVGAGFSETAFAVQAGLWGLVLLYALWQRKARIIKALIPILIGLSLGAALLMLSPSNSLRQNRFPSPPSLAVLIEVSVGYARDFFVVSLRGTPLPFLAVMSMGFMFGWLYLPTNRIHWLKAFFLSLFLILALFLLLVAIMAPTMYTMSVYASPRSLFIGNFLFVLLFFILGMLAGTVSVNLFKRNLLNKMLALAPLLIAIFFSVYSIRFIPSIYASISVYQERARVWDERNESILKARAEGELRPVVSGIDSIALIYELQTDPHHYVNVCAADYYGLEAIISNE